MRTLDGKKLIREIKAILIVFVTVKMKYKISTSDPRKKAFF
jgi:hypothetical protein